MGCYCMEYAIKFKQAVLDVNFNEYIEGEPIDSEKYMYCQDWAYNYAV